MFFAKRLRKVKKIKGAIVLLFSISMTFISCGERTKKHLYHAERQTFEIEEFDYKRDFIDEVAIDSQQRFLFFGTNKSKKQNYDSSQSFVLVGEPSGEWKKYNIGLGEVYQVFVTGSEWKATLIDRNKKGTWIATDLITSTDRGKTWIKRYSFPFPIYKIFFLDPLTGYAFPSSSYSEYHVWFTPDGGSHWQQLEDSSLYGVIGIFELNKDAFGICHSNDTFSFLRFRGLQVEKIPVIVPVDAEIYDMVVVEDGVLLSVYSRASKMGKWIRVRLDNYSVIDYAEGYEWVSIDSEYWDGQLFVLAGYLLKDDEDESKKVLMVSRDIGKTWQAVTDIHHQFSYSSCEFYKNNFIGYSDSNLFQVVNIKR